MIHKIFSKLGNQSVIFPKRIAWCITGAKKGKYDAFQSKYSFSAYVCLIKKSEYGQQQQQQKSHVPFSEDFKGNKLQYREQHGNKCIKQKEPIKMKKSGQASFQEQV